MDGRDAVVEDLRRRLAARAPGAELRADVTFPELGLDSADVLELVADLEDHHHVALPLNGLTRVRTFEQLVEHLVAAIRARGAGA